MTEAPEFLAIGHVVKDWDPEAGDYRIGGTAAYSALTAVRLGLRAAMVTSIESEEPLLSFLEGVEVSIVPSAKTTRFTNIYSEGQRSQRVGTIASRIGPGHIPRPWLGASIVHMTPVAQEVEPEIARLFGDSLLCVSPQGWMRRWNEDGDVCMADWEGAEAILSRADILVVSEEDLGDQPDLEQTFASRVPVTVVTQGNRGARLYAEGLSWHVSGAPAREIDPTGAGDVYAAAMAVKYKETGDPLGSAAFAACAASFAVEGCGVATIPTREQVDTRLSCSSGAVTSIPGCGHKL